MKIVFCFSALLLLSAGVLGANKKAGEACTSTDTCETIGSYCDASGSCACNVGFVLAGNTCARVHGQVCDSSMCSSSEMICKESKCACDASAHLVKSGTGCTCDTDYTRNSAGKCVKMNDKECSADSDCLDNAKCVTTGSTKACKCDSGYKDNSQLTGCVCDDDYTLRASDNTCVKKLNVACETDTECGLDNAKCTETVPNDASSKQCKCTTKYADNGSQTACDLSCTSPTVEEDGVCKVPQGDDCTSGTCVNNANCVSNECVCDTSKHYAAATNNVNCACDSANGYTMRTSDSTCVKKLNEACEADTECGLDNAKCTQTDPNDANSKQCKCTTNYADNGSQTACTLRCSATEVETDNMCKIRAGQSCTAGTDTCVDGTTCTGGKCKCDDSANQEANTATGYCKCKDKYTFNSDRVCAKDIGETCTNTESSVPCIDGAICDKKTKKCVCDAANNFQASGNSACICMSDFTPSGNRCLAPVGGDCVAKDAANVCVSGASCVDNTTTTTVVDYSCTCSNKANYDGTCGGAVGVVASLITMMSSVIVASYLM